MPLVKNLVNKMEIISAIPSQFCFLTQARELVYWTVIYKQ